MTEKRLRSDLPEAREALRRVAEQEGEFFHLVGDDGEGLSGPLDGELIAERARAARGRLHNELSAASVEDAPTIPQHLGRLTLPAMTMHEPAPGYWDQPGNQ